ncbi:hydrogenase maturation nickel metallochaperone HypA [Helicobacter sp. 16-1353]|uniref:hydrogenase/urease nickel incorporation protein HypA n=1 Tax=Helicobacter sp. 16-1353 TaxID=2004996 RepID=UPI000DCC169D|nr:hydrogenase/urease nickel incorporation protein HypA [Helicobacter sp. 16-1353]RAX54879.1 hydrogenase maturation nickel metallochaperone HypA [Helicobacter sp. 16-1353]
MHEYSVVSSLILLCEEEALKNNAKNIITITIEIGERSGVEVELLKSAFEFFKEESRFCKNSILEIVHKNITLHCNDCNFKFTASGLNYGICPQCNSNNVIIIEGKELNLLRLEME